MNRLLLLALLCSPTLSANELVSAEAKLLAEQLKQHVAPYMNKIAQYELKAGVTIDQLALTINQEPQFNTGRFGALLDTQKTGLVLSVTPQSSAEKLGIKAGDKITKVNGNNVQSSDNAWITALQSQEKSTDVSLEVIRQNKPITLQGQLQPIYTPGWQLSINTSPLTLLSMAEINSPQVNNNNCGRIMINQETSELMAINNQAIANNEYGIYRLPLGDVALTIKGTGKAAEFRAQTAKITIEPNTTYHIAYVKNSMIAKNVSSRVASKHIENNIILIEKIDDQCDLSQEEISPPNALAKKRYQCQMNYHFKSDTFTTSCLTESELTQERNRELLKKSPQS